MTAPDDPNQLVAATQTLAERVHELGQKIALSEESQREIKAHQAEIQSQAKQQAKNVAAIAEGNRRQRRWIRVQAVCGVLLLGGLIWLWNVAAAANDAASGVRTNAVTNCQNSNQARQGTLRLWLGIIDAPRPKGSPARTEEQQQQIADLRLFVEQLFQQRDCQNLDRQYPLPELPDSLKPRSE